MSEEKAKTINVNNKAIESQGKKFSLVWIIPLLALVTTIMLLITNSLNKGKEITLRVQSAAGIEAGKTQLKLRSVPIGKVTDVNLSDDYSGVVITIQMNKNTDNLLHEDTLFWLVKPRIESAGISDLDTIFLGSYFQLSPGQSKTMSTSFTALSAPPAMVPDSKGVKFKLKYLGQRHLNIGDNITYKGFNVGSILSVDFNVDKNEIIYEVFVNEPYSKLLNSSSRFWIASGVDISLSSAGFDFKTDSLTNILRSGISFENFRNNTKDLKLVQHNEILDLFDSKKEAHLDFLSKAKSYVVFLNKKYGNIKEGSDIIYKNSIIGKVIKAPFTNDYKYLFSNNDMPVLFAIDVPEGVHDFIIKSISESIKNKSICANPHSSSIISLNDQIELKFNQKNCYLKTKDYLGKQVLAVNSNPDAEGDMSSIMAKINEVDFKSIGNNLNSALVSISKAMDDFSVTNKALKRNDVISGFKQSLNNFDDILNDYNNNSAFYHKLNETLLRIESLLNDVAPGLNALGQNPSNLIFGSEGKDIEPRKAKE